MDSFSNSSDCSCENRCSCNKTDISSVGSLDRHFSVGSLDRYTSVSSLDRQFKKTDRFEGLPKTAPSGVGNKYLPKVKKDNKIVNKGKHKKRKDKDNKKDDDDSFTIFKIDL